MQTVRYSGGPLAGAVLEMPAGLAAERLNLTVTPGGVVFDRDRRRPVRGARVIEAPRR